MIQPHVMNNCRAVANRARAMRCLEKHFFGYYVYKPQEDVVREPVPWHRKLWGQLFNFRFFRANM